MLGGKLDDDPVPLPLECGWISFPPGPAGRFTPCSPDGPANTSPGLRSEGGQRYERVGSLLNLTKLRSGIGKVGSVDLHHVRFSVGAAEVGTVRATLFDSPRTLWILRGVKGVPQLRTIWTDEDAPDSARCAVAGFVGTVGRLPIVARTVQTVSRGQHRPLRLRP